MSSQDQSAIGSQSSTGSTEKKTTPKKPLHSFFKPRTNPKKQSTALSPTGVAAIKEAVLPSDVQERIARNRAAARAKLLARAAANNASDTDLAAGLEPSWKTALSKTLSLPFCTDLAKFVAEERKKATVYPSPGCVFSAFNHSSFKRTKVVIIGQDPYHGPRQAHGMSFSVLPGVAHPPSLKNIFKEVADDIDGFKVPSSGCLEQWANQGVLLLNSVLTVRAHEPFSHQGRGWERITSAVVEALNKRPGKGIVFMLWGGAAKKKGARVDKKRHCVLTAAHPSPLSAHRGWFGSKHFSEANMFLVKTGQTPVDWALDE